MKHLLRLAALTTAVGLVTACDNPFDGKPKLEDDKAKFSYALGVDIGRSLIAVRDDLDVKAMQQGFTDAQAKEPKLAFSDAELEQIKMSAIERLRAKKMQEMQGKASGASAEGDKFLAGNAKKAGVKTTASGLQYEVLKEGSGAHPKASDTVTVNYKGTLLNGEVFDSSYERGQPATFRLDQVIPGWTEGVQLMTVGSKYKFYIPSKLGYGEQGAGGKIGPNATLTFEVELLAIK